jgi:hypothetical protein
MCSFLQGNEYLFVPYEACLIGGHDEHLDGGRWPRVNLDFVLVVRFLGLLPVRSRRGERNDQRQQPPTYAFHENGLPTSRRLSTCAEYRDSLTIGIVL